MNEDQRFIPQPLLPIYQKMQGLTEIRPFKEDGTKDGNWHYVHRQDTILLIELAYKAGLEAQQK